ncbi:MAG: phosphatase PAP2 family protein [Rubrivivax sp.]
MKKNEGPARGGERHAVPTAAIGVVLALVLALALASCATTVDPPATAAGVPEARPGSGYLIGYLAREELPRSDLFLPEAPRSVAAGSSDDLAARAAFAGRAQPRWSQAAADAELKFPAAARAFSCALGFEPSEAGTPHLTMLLRRTLTDAGLATYAAKNRYARQRPFAALAEKSCTPLEEAFLARDGSYPSGHAAIGWAWALVLSEAAPARRDALLRRGYAFGQSRVACGVHWQTDVDAGRVVGAAAVSALRSNPLFTAQLALAGKEVAAKAKENAAAPAHCGAEEAALKGF